MHISKAICIQFVYEKLAYFMTDITDLEMNLPDCPMYNRKECARVGEGWRLFLGNVPTFWRSI